MIAINYEILRQYTELFSNCVLKASRFLDERFPEQTTYDFHRGVDFNAGFILMEEGYKKAAVQKQNQYLHVSSWDDNAILTGTVANEVLALINDDELDNLIDWRDKDIFKLLLKDESNRMVMGDCLRDIFCGNDSKNSFQHAQNCIGNKFPIISYLFFIKDPEKFLPVRPDNFSDRFQAVGISGWKRACSWENYMDFISSIEEVQIFLMDYLHDETISLLDAHSFIWMEWMTQISEEELLKDVEKHYRDALGKKQIESNTSVDLAKEVDRIEAEVSNLKGEEREAVIRCRVNQGIFRKRLMNRYNRCCLCPVSNKSFLNASHIKPWAVSEDAEKLERDNGFLMCPNHDTLFDKGYISFGDDGRIIISSELAEIDKIFMNVNSDMCIELTEGNKRYLQYHREHVFRGE